MIEKTVVEMLNQAGHVWLDKDDNPVSPDEESVLVILDLAAENLKDLSPGDNFAYGGLLVEKAPGGKYDVYVRAGEYV